jgi:hypothetical protein
MTSLMRINLLVAATAASLWILAYLFNEWLLDFAQHTAGVHLAFLPSGVRLLALLVGGFWAAVGIALGTFVCLVFEFGLQALHRIAAVALASGFGAYLALLAVCRIAGVRPSLENLRPVHLPLVALGVALGSSAIINALYVIFGEDQWQYYVEHVAAMAAGDMVGSLLVILLVMGAVRLWRVTGKAA